MEWQGVCCSGVSELSITSWVFAVEGVY